MTDDALRDDVARYYTDKVRRHGPSAQGVDWRDDESQQMRFTQLLRVADDADRVEVLDYGCGYGALVDELDRDGRPFRWVGFDISDAMLDEARARYGDRAECSVVADEATLEALDFVVASGIFNVRLETDEGAWRRYVERVIDRLDALSRRGFAFNMLTSYSEPEKMRPDLYYADPLAWFDRCKRQYSRQVALLHDYELWEFTIVVRKDA
jgi:SAM-dependent methyltransferase